MSRLASLTRLPLVAPLLCSAVVAVAGFVVMGLLWLRATPAPGVPGWTDYSAATFGDGGLLPVLAASLVVIVRGLPRRRQGELRTFLVAGAIGMVGGALLQVSWLLDDSPELNWSLPRPHHFSVSGWYHAIFLCIVSALFASLILTAATRARSLRLEDADQLQHLVNDHQGWLYLGLLSLWGFCGLVATDGGQGYSAVSTVGTVGIVAVASLGLLVWVLGPLFRETAALVGRAAVSAAALVALVQAWPANGLAGAGLVMAVALAGVVSLRDLEWRSRVVEAASVALVCGALLIVPLGQPQSVVRNLALAAATPVAILVLTGATGRSASARRRARLGDITLSSLLVLTLPAAAWFASRPTFESNVGAVVVAITTGLVASRMFPVYQRDFEHLQAAEQAAGTTADPRLSELAVQISMRAAFYAILALTGLLALGVVGAQALGFEQGNGSAAVSRNVLVGIGAAILAGVLAFLFRKRSGRVSKVLTLVVCACLSIPLALDIMGQQRHSVWVWLAVLTGLVVLWHLESIVWNVGMRPRWVAGRRWAQCVGVCYATTVGLLVFWRSSAGLYAASGSIAGWTTTFAPLALTVALTMGLAFLVGESFRERRADTVDGDPPNFARYRLRSALLQDAGLMAILSIVAVWMPLLVHAHMPTENAVERWAAVIGMASAPVLFFAPAFFWCLRNNVKHVAEQAQAAGVPHTAIAAGHLPRVPRGEELEALRNCYSRGTGPIDRAAWVRNLRVHIRHQNVLATVLALVSLAGIVGLVNERPDRAAQVSRP